MKFKNIIIATMIMGVSSVYGDIGPIILKKNNDHIYVVTTVDKNQLELHYSAYKNMNLVTPGIIVEDSGEENTLSNYILKHLYNGKLPIRKDINLDLCGKTTHILSIGINEYQQKRLKYSVSDAKIIALKMQRSCNTTDIKLLLDHEATKTNIISSTEKITKKVNNDDTVIIFFSGLGSIEKSKKTILPIDVKFKNNTFTDGLFLSDIAEMLSGTKARIFILIDASFHPLSR